MHFRCASPRLWPQDTELAPGTRSQLPRVKMTLCPKLTSPAGAAHIQLTSAGPSPPPSGRSPTHSSPRSVMLYLLV